MILLIAVALALIILIRRAQRQPPHKRRAAYMQIIFGGAVVGVVVLTLMGKMHWIGAALTGALVIARQTLPPADSSSAHAGKSAGSGNPSSRQTV